MSEAYRSPSDVSLERFQIESPNGKKLDFTDLIQEFNIYESLGSPVLRADMAILDAAALYGNLPIVGQEKITGTIVRGYDRHDVTFYCTNLTDLKNVNDFTMTYTMNLVEESFFNNAVSLISQSYEGSASEIASSVATEYLKTELDADPSNGNYRVVIPNWNPYYVLKWITKRAISDNGIPFVCFNTWRNGLKFKSLKTLFDQDPVDEYFYNKRRNENNNIQDGDATMTRETVQTAEVFYPIAVAPTVEVLQNGGYGSTTLLADILYKTVDTQQFNYQDAFESMAHAASRSVIHPNFKINDLPLYQHATTKQNNFFHSSASFDTHDNFNSNTLDTVPLRAAHLETLKNFQYKLIVKGRTDLEVGKTVDLKILKNLIVDESNQDELFDDRRSGKHLITGLRHQFSNDKYRITMDVARDTMEKEL